MFLRLDDIYYSQGSISDRFSDGSDVEKLCRDLRRDGYRYYEEEMAPIKVVDAGSYGYYSLDNRRLYALRHSV